GQWGYYYRITHFAILFPRTGSFKPWHSSTCNLFWSAALPRPADLACCLVAAFVAHTQCPARRLAAGARPGIERMRSVDENGAACSTYTIQFAGTQSSYNCFRLPRPIENRCFRPSLRRCREAWPLNPASSAPPAPNP